MLVIIYNVHFTFVRKVGFRLVIKQFIRHYSSPLFFNVLQNTNKSLQLVFTIYLQEYPVNNGLIVLHLFDTINYAKQKKLQDKQYTKQTLAVAAVHNGVISLYLGSTTASHFCQRMSVKLSPEFQK